MTLLAGCAPSADQQADQLTMPNFSLVTSQGDIAMCGGSGSNNNNSIGIDRTCLIHGDIKLALSFADGVQSYEVNTAIESWNELLGELTSMPKLKDDGSPGAVPFTVHDSSQADEYCGRTLEGSGGRVLQVDIWPASDPNCNSGGSGTLGQIAAHELSHVLGWNRGHGGSPGSANSYTVGCAAFLHIGTVPLSDHACHHDIEALFRAKSNPAGWTFSEQYVTSPILYYTDAPASASVQAGNTTLVSITHWLGTTGASISKGNSSVGWASGNSAIFTVSSSGLVTGQSAGSAKLYLRARGTPTGYTVWTPFAINGDSVTIQVTASPYVVTSDQTPITTAGYHTFTAHVGDPGVPHIWTVDDSRTIHVIPDTSFGTPDNTATLWVEAGSYTLRFGVSGGGYQDIPVCTDGGDLFAAGKSPSKGLQGSRKWPGPTPTVVEGCLPGQGGGDQ